LTPGRRRRGTRLARARGIEIYKGRPIFTGSVRFFSRIILSTQDNRDQRNLDPRFTSRGETETRLNGGPPSGVVDKTGLLGSWDVSILPVMTYEGGRVKEIRIYPIDVRRSAQAKQSGLPRIAAPELGRRILASCASSRRRLVPTFASKATSA
jgi:poly-gamma-glutamate synthesis protein (capsule biosynthesis protein)